MQDKLCIFICNNLAPEASQIIQTGDYPDVKLLSYPSNCLGSPLTNEKITQLIAQDNETYSKILFIVSSCYSKFKLDKPNSRKIEFIQNEQCFEFLLNKELIYHFINQGYYITSSGWLKELNKQIDHWGFNEDSAKTFFRESLKKILFLDTGLPEDSLPNLEKLSKYMGLPYEILPIGLSYCRHFLDAEITKWRAEKERLNQNEELSKFSKEKADYTFIFSQLQNLVEYHDESRIINDMFSLLNVLVAPKKIDFRRFDDGIEIEKFWWSNGNVDIQQKSESILSFEIKFQNDVLGIFDIYGVDFPEYLEQYRSISPIISKMCGVSIANARKYSIIQVQSEKLQNNALQLKELIQTKDKFFSIVAHDLRGALGGLMGLAELMADESFALSDSDKKEMTKVLSSSSRNIYSLLENLLEWSKMQRGLTTFEPKKLKLTNIVSEIFKLLGESARNKEIEFILELSEKTEVFADLFMIQTIIRNLVSNAVKFTSKGGQIVVSEKTGDDSMNVIAIKDNGIGMSKAFLDNLFRIDVNTNRKGTEGEPSTGLGLMLCKDFVEIHGGKIWIESEEGKGTTFYFTLPGKSDF